MEDDLIYCNKDKTPRLPDYDAQAFTDELAMRAKIIAEYMQQHAITDINRGIRAFTAYERERLQRLGLLVAPRPGTCNVELTNSRN